MCDRYAIKLEGESPLWAPLGEPLVKATVSTAGWNLKKAVCKMPA